MNCKRAEEQLSRAMDGELAAEELRELEAHLVSCSQCKVLREEWSRYTSFLREPVQPVQTPEALWADVQRAIRLQAADRGEAGATVFGWRLRWAGVIIALVLIGAYGIGMGLRRQTGKVVASMAEKSAEVEFVETDVPGASPMVYEDAESGWMVIWVAGADTASEAPQGT